MSIVDIKSCLHGNQARKLLSEVLQSGTLLYSRHAEEQMAERNLTKNDVLNVLCGGHIFEPGELVNGSWRYRVHTDMMAVAVAFADATRVVVVTAWRKS